VVSTEKCEGGGRADSLPSVTSEHTITIAPGLLLILDSAPLNPSDDLKRAVLTFAVLPSNTEFLLENFGVLYYGHADPPSADVWELLNRLRRDLNLQYFEFAVHGAHFRVKGLNIITRVPAHDLVEFLGTTCLSPATISPAEAPGPS
jgi:hypothetical protein